MSKNPRISIGLTVYNGEKYVAQAIESLLAQTFTDFELIISDNGSSDNSPAICQDFADRDDRIRYVRHEENHGANWNYNYVFSLGRGEYFKWADQDDLCSPEFLERCIEILDEKPEVVWCHSASVKIDAKGRVVQGVGNTRNARGEVCRSPQAHRRFRDILLHSTHWGIRCSGVFRRNVLEQTGLYRPYYGSENILCAEVALAGRYQQVPEALFSQRVHVEASSMLESSSAQQEFACPGRRVRLPRLLILRDYFHLAVTAPISPWQRLMCVMWVMFYLLQFRKWPRVLRNLILRRGVGGGELNVRCAIEDKEAADSPAKARRPLMVDPVDATSNPVAAK